jgi:CRP-like cAMP-binding protein
MAALQFREMPHRPAGAPAGIFPAQNALLAALPAAELAALEAELRPAYFARGASIAEQGGSAAHVYFVVSGVVSLGHTAANGESAEIAIVGREGVTGVEAILGAEDVSHRALAQTACLAYGLSTRTARSRFWERGAFYRVVVEYALNLMLQISHASVCSLHHTLEQRLCRALLQSADCLSSSTLPLTQDVLASLINGRRQGVSEALQKLRDHGLVTSGRGSIAVLDRAGLLARACDCYDIVQEHRNRLFASL